MKALQLHYTSCRRGQAGNAGFQTRSLTPGIRTDEQREIERRGVYRPPRDARQDPSDEEIARDFPLAFRWYTLESGRQALSRCRYTGQDYSGRWGNFFAHTLVAEPGELAVGRWPIDLYEWEGWREPLPPEEDTEATPPPLPCAEMTVVAPAESFRLDELGEFLREEPGRRDLLAKMGHAVLLGRDSSRAVVIRDTPNRGLYWVACLQKLFPPEHARSLSYSTYQDDPRGCANVNATTGETDFTFDESERRFRFYMFDLATGQHSDLPPAADSYPAVASHWLAEEPATLAAFFDFMALFDHRHPEPGLIAAVHLFELSRDRLSQINGERLSAMISFCSSHGTPAGKVALLEILGRAAVRPDAGLRAEDSSLLIRFLAEGARATGKPEHRGLVFGAWLSLLDGVVKRNGDGLAIAEGEWNEIRRGFPTHARDLATRLLADPVCRDEESRLRGLPTEVPLFLLRVAWESSELTGSAAPWETPAVQGFLRAAINGSGDLVALVRAVLAVIPREPEPLTAMVLQIRDLPSQGPAETDVVIGRALSGLLADVPSEVARRVRRQLESTKLWDLLLSEWAELCERADDPVAAFVSYRAAVFDHLPSYEANRLPAAASILLRRLPETRRAALALDWLQNGQVDRFPERLASECVSLANREVSLDLKAPGGDSTAQLVRQAAARMKLSLQPDRPLLRDALASAQDSQLARKDLRLPQVREAVARLTVDDYSLFLAGFLLPALARVGSQLDHQQLLLATLNSSHAGIFAKAYLEFFKAKPKVVWPESLHGALRFWLAFDSPAGSDEALCLRNLEETGKKGLLVALGRLPPKDFDRVRQKLRQARLDPRVSGRWDDLQAALEKKRKSPWSRLVGIFGRD